MIQISNRYCLWWVLYSVHHDTDFWQILSMSFILCSPWYRFLTDIVYELYTLFTMIQISDRYCLWWVLYSVHHDTDFWQILSMMSFILCSPWYRFLTDIVYEFYTLFTMIQISDRYCLWWVLYYVHHNTDFWQILSMMSFILCSPWYRFLTDIVCDEFYTLFTMIQISDRYCLWVLYSVHHDTDFWQILSMMSFILCSPWYIFLTDIVYEFYTLFTMIHVFMACFSLMMEHQICLSHFLIWQNYS